MISFSALLPPCSPDRPHVLRIIKEKNSFYGFTSQQPRYAFVKIGGKLEPHVNLNGRHLVAIRAMLRILETHSGLCSGESTMDSTTLAQITMRTFIRSERIWFNERADGRACRGHACRVYEQIRAAMDSKASPHQRQIFHKL